MNVSPTQRESYRQLVEDNELGPKQRAVLAALYIDGPGTREEIAVRAGLRLSSVCGRVRELLVAGVIEEIGTKFNAGTKKRNAVLALKDRQGRLFQ